MRKKILVAVAIGAVAVAVGFIANSASAGSSTSVTDPTIVDDSSVHPSTTTVGGADVLPTTRTVAHFFGSSVNPNDGVTYGFNMVGADPNNCSGSACSTTIPTDIVPLTINVGGRTFAGSNVVAPILASPLFAPNDYTSTSRSTANPTGFTSGGPLSSGNTNVQLEDATMRSKFNQTGSSPYHVILGNVVVHDPITINVPANHGTLIQTGRGVVAGDVNITWFASQLNNIITNTSYIDPTHLPIFVTDNVMLYIGPNPLNCCVIGFHGASKVPARRWLHQQQRKRQGTDLAWGSYVTPGFFDPNVRLGAAGHPRS